MKSGKTAREEKTKNEKNKTKNDPTNWKRWTKCG